MSRITKVVSAVQIPVEPPARTLRGRHEQVGHVVDIQARLRIFEPAGGGFLQDDNKLPTG